MINVEVFAPAGLTNFFTRQHRHIDELCIQTLGSGGPERERAFFMLRRFLAVHRAAESQIVEPRAERVLTDGHRLAQQRQAENRAIADTIGELERLDVDTDRFVYRLAQLYRTLGRQAEDEERQEFCALGPEAPTDDLDRVARAVAALESIEPGDKNLDLELTHVLVGSFDAMVRRADDIVGDRR